MPLKKINTTWPPIAQGCSSPLWLRSCINHNPLALQQLWRATLMTFRMIYLAPWKCCDGSQSMFSCTSITVEVPSTSGLGLSTGMHWEMSFLSWASASFICWAWETKTRQCCLFDDTWHWCFTGANYFFLLSSRCYLYLGTQTLFITQPLSHELLNLPFFILSPATCSFGFLLHAPTAVFPSSPTHCRQQLQMSRLYPGHIALFSQSKYWAKSWGI